LPFGLVYTRFLTDHWRPRVLMLFNSIEFIFVFLPAAVAIHFGLARWSIAAAVVGTTVSSLVFYMWWNPPYVALPIASIAANFWLARVMAAVEKVPARHLLIAGIVANVLVLAYYKYADFLLAVVHGTKAAPPNVPLALSFTTFVQIAFLVDVYRRRIPLDFARYSLFVSFFPHLIAGPIVRWNNLGRQLNDVSRFRLDWNNIALGLTIFTFGLAKKVLIADRLSPHIAPVFDAAAMGEPVTAVAAWGAALAFTGQIYFDFSGYSDMAIGLGLLFNFRLPLNFAAPLRSTSLIDFWRRWHITLSQFLRDYIYGPLTFGRPATWWRATAVMLTMVLAGVWHGAGWTFVIWGAYHGALLLVNAAWQQAVPAWGQSTRAGQAMGWLLTFTAFTVGAAFFRAADIDASRHLLTAMIGLGNAPVPESLTLPWDRWAISRGYFSEHFARYWFGTTWSMVAMVWTIGALAIALLMPDTMEFVGYKEGEAQSDWRRNVGVLAWRPSLLAAGVVIILFFEVFSRLGEVSEFLYYQF
jgi:alginate O-acetyltransferase complex protein AlgI